MTSATPALTIITDESAVTCAEIEQMLPLVADAVIDAESDPLVFAHLARCQVCQASLAQHDLVTLVLATAPLRRAAPTLAVVHYRLPRRWIAAAAAVLAVVGSVTAYSLRSPGPASDAVAQQEVIHLLDPVTGVQRPLLLIHQGKQSTLVDPASFDYLHDAPAAGNAPVVPVRMRY